MIEIEQDEYLLRRNLLMSLSEVPFSDVAKSGGPRAPDDVSFEIWQGKKHRVSP